MIPAPTSRDQTHLLRLPNWLGDLILSVPAVRLYQSWLNDRAQLAVAGPASLAPLAPMLLPNLDYISVPTPFVWPWNSFPCPTGPALSETYGMPC